VVTFANGENKGCMLAGFTIRGGSSGVYCHSSNATISNCVIVNNAGPGVDCFGENPESDYTTISNCVIAANNGDGVYSHGSRPIITNCTITDNAGRGIYCYYCRGTTTVTNSVVWANSDDQIALHYAPISVTYSDVEGGWPGLGNIDAEPLFAQSGHHNSNNYCDPADPLCSVADYHLQSQAGRWDPDQNTWVTDPATSPCIDAGNSGFALGDETDDANNRRINMGAFGGTSEASKAPGGWSLLADLTNDGRVNFIDLAHQATIVGEHDNALPGDLDRNAAVDMADVGLLAEDWLKTTIWRQ
jgi:parallel beta-helix repeat protein